MHKIKVLVIGPEPPPPGGMATIISQMKCLNYPNFELIFINTSKGAWIKKIKIINYLYVCYKTLTIFGIMMWSRPKIVHIHTASNKSFWQNAPLIVFSHYLKMKIVVHIHGGLFKEFYSSSNVQIRKVIKIVLDRADKVIVLSNYWMTFFAGIINSSKISIIQNCVYYTQLNKYRKNNKTRKRDILFVGKISELKGIYELLDAMKSLSDYKLTVVGDFENNENDIRAHWKRNNLQDKVTFVGPILGNERFNYFQQADILVLPSRYEAFGIVLLEAMALGLPVIATEVGGIPDFISSRNGLLIRPKSPKAIINAIVKIAENPELYEKISKYNKLYVKNGYNITIFRKKINELYKSLLNYGAP